MISVPVAFLAFLLESLGGSVVFTMSDLMHQLDSKKQIVTREMRDPWQTVYKVEENK